MKQQGINVMIWPAFSPDSLTSTPTVQEKRHWQPALAGGRTTSLMGHNTTNRIPEPYPVPVKMDRCLYQCLRNAQGGHTCY